MLVLYDRKKNKKEESESYSAKAALDRTSEKKGRQVYHKRRAKE